MDAETQWYHDTMKEFDPKGYQEMIQNSKQMQEQQNQQPNIYQTMQEVDQEVQSGNVDVPFENVPPKEEEFQAEPQAEVEPQQPAQQQEFQAIQYGAPAETQEQKEPEKENNDPLENVHADNPWNTPENIEQINIFQEHKKRLNLDNDRDLLPHVRDYFKDEHASIASITPEILKDFNNYLINIQA